MSKRVLIFVFSSVIILFSYLHGQTTVLSVDTQIPAKNATQGSLKHQLFHFHLARDAWGSIQLTAISFSTTGTYLASDLTKFQVWSNTVDSFSSASQLGPDITSGLGGGAHSHTGLSLALPQSSTTYFWITADLSISAGIGRTIYVKEWTTGNYTVSSGFKSGSAAAGGTQTFVAFASLASDYFRSNATGNWATTATWQSSHDNVNWGTATLSPNSSANTITVSASTKVTVASNVTVDEVTVNGTLAINGSVTLTVADNLGTDLVINNTLEKTGTGQVSYNPGATASFASGSYYVHQNTTDSGSIPVASWHANSYCVISGYTTNTTAPTGLGQNFGNFEWNCPSQTGNISLDGALTTISSNLKIASTGTGTLVLSGSGNLKLTIGGNLVITGGTLCLVSGSGKPILEILGSYVQSGGILDVNRNITGTWNVSTINIYTDFVQTGGSITKTITATAYYGDLVLKGNSGSFGYTQEGDISDKVRITKNGTATMNLLSNVSWPSKVSVSSGTIDFGNTARTMSFSGVADSISFAGSTLLLNGGDAKHGIVYRGSTSVLTFPDVYAHGTADYFEFANTGGTQVLNLSQSFNILRIKAASGANIIIGNDAASHTITVADSLHIGSGSLTLCGSASSNTNTLICEGNYNQEGGILELCNSADGSGMLEIGKRFRYVGGSFKGSLGSSTVTFDNSESEIFVESTGVLMSGPIDFVVTDNTIFYFSSPTSLIWNTNANCNFTNLGTSSLVICHPEGIAASGFFGCIQVGGERNFSPTGTYRYNGTGSQDTGSGLVSCNTLILDCAAGVALSSDATILGGLILSSGLFTNAALSPNITMSDDATIYRHAGSLANPPLLSGRVSNIYYGGCITGSELTPSVNDLVIAAGGNTVTLSSSVRVERNLHLQDGNLSIAANTLELSGGTIYDSGIIIGGETSNIVVSGAEAEFPVRLYDLNLNNLAISRSNGFQMLGDIILESTVSIGAGCIQDTDLAYYLDLANPSSELRGAGYWFGTVLQNIGNRGFISAPLGISIGAGISISSFAVTQLNEAVVEHTGYGVGRTWILHGNCSDVVPLSFSWPQSADNGLDFDRWDAQVWRNNGGSWFPYGTKQTVNTDPRQITVYTNSFSRWTVTTEDQTLPVELSSFLVNINANNLVQLQWVTQSETNVAGFRIYRANSDVQESALCLNVFIPATNTSQLQTYIFVDEEVFEPGLYYYWLENIDLDGNSALHGPVSVNFQLNNPGTPAIPLLEGLAALYPNPFSSQLSFKYAVATQGVVELSVYNLKGQKLRCLLAEPRGCGIYGCAWDARDAAGRQVASGVYLLTMKAGDKRWVKKLVLSR